MENEIDFGNESVPEQTERVKASEELIDENSFSNQQFIKNPPVGEITEQLTVQKLVKNFNVKRRKKTGKEFSIALSNTEKDGQIPYCITFYTDKGLFTPSNWEVVNKLIRGLIPKAKEQGLVKGTCFGEGVTFSVKHILDGMQNRDSECYEVTWIKPDGSEEIIPKK